MKKFFKIIPLLLWLLTFLTLSLGYLKGSEFVQSRGSLLCLSCMGLEENENF